MNAPLVLPCLSLLEANKAISLPMMKKLPLSFSSMDGQVSACKKLPAVVHQQGGKQGAHRLI
jgi:hypothetical protein